ncbi:glycosyltransferase family 4 protein [Levilactobacillus namurensis]|uniref:glycosyltransferase family 4 protein n=1 Tax=Levilactobacillus namurensis TaxID=380393 RepID=UPI002232A548|nr:glycosyltransferase family 4 protein [Levilactobacillus namurensis]MCW3779549.1 glycosyltransferase family 4 protein [Levilactobacillus namurensis]MDT7018157.1 glycosyltransferase family 4 protein [Levilactobacillus namurensis]WNN64855.1 glycosyltransferase family 4 protein [Levilactobacillus namurensis]
MEWQENFYSLNTHIFTMSHWLEKFLKSQGKYDVHYVGAGANIPAITQNNILRNNHTALFIGHDFYRKGGDIVIEAFKKLHTEDPKFRLIIAGPEEIPNKYQNISGMQFLGPINYSQVSRLMKQATFFVMPSRFEAFGLVFVEAMENGLPIIARNCFEMPYFVKEGSGILINPGNDEIQQTYQAMKEIFNNLIFQKMAEQKANEITESYSWDSVAKRMLQIIQK